MKNEIIYIIWNLSKVHLVAKKKHTKLQKNILSCKATKNLIPFLDKYKNICIYHEVCFNVEKHTENCEDSSYLLHSYIV